MTQLKTSETGYSLIKAFEGFRAQAAPLANGGWVIGYGHTASAKAGVRISRQDAADLLRWDVHRLEQPLQDMIYAPLNQNQFDALISLVFNIGLENFKSSAVLRYLNEGCPVNAAAGFDAWRCASLAGKIIIVDALVRRRAAEKALFLASPGANVVAPTPQLPPLYDPQVIDAIEHVAPLEVTVDMDGEGEIHVEAEAVEATAGVAAPSRDETADYVPLDDVLGAGADSAAKAPESTHSEAAGKDGGDSPIAVAAEKIIGHLDQIALDNESTLQEPPLETALVDADAMAPQAPAVTEEDTVQHTPLETQAETPPVMEEPETEESETKGPVANEERGLSWDKEERPEQDNANNPSAFDSEDMDFFDFAQDEPPLLQTDAPLISEDHDFQPAHERGWIIFMLMGVIGIGLVLSGLWQLQMRGGTVTDTIDLVMGPGQAGLGILVVTVSAYALLRRLGANVAVD